MKELGSILLILILSFKLNAQVHLGPSLTASTSKIAYEKGKLDAELIAEIIASKQEEIKKELMNRTVLNCLECGSFATWNYARQSMDVLLNERDSRVITKELLKYTTELAVAMGISEFYLRFLGKRSLSKSLNNNEKKFLLQYFKWMDLDSKRALAGTFISVDSATDLLTQLPSNSLKEEKYENVALYYETLAYYTGLSKQGNKEGNKKVNQKIDNMELVKSETRNISTSIPDETGKFLAEIGYLKRFNNSNKRFREGKDSYNANLTTPCDAISPNHILIDMVHAICRKNNVLKDYGFFQNIGVNDSTYKYKNKYTIFYSEIGADYRTVEKEVNALVNVIFGSFSSLKELYSYKDATETVNTELVEKVIAEIKSKADNNINLDTIVQSIQKVHIDTLNKEIKEDWSILLDDVIKLAQYQGQNQGKKDNDLSFFIRESVLPKLIKINIASSNDLKNLIDKISTFEKNIKLNALKKLKTDFDSLYIILNEGVEEKRRQNTLQFENFIQLVNTINNLEDPSTYDVIGKFIANMGGIFGDNRAITVFNQFVNDFDKYVLVDKEKDELEINVEDIALDLYKRFGEGQSARLTAYFSVGVNNSLVEKPKRFLDGKDVHSLNFVSEKIGLKFKIVNWNRRISYGIAAADSKNTRIKQYLKNSGVRKKPIVGDLHLMLYGSGLLYQVEFLNSESNQFSAPIIGGGLGVSFFNGLDLNLSYATPTNTTFDNGFWNVGFDIKITEYLTALGKKNKK